MSMSAIAMDKRLGCVFVSIAVAIIGVLTTTAGAQRRLQMEVQVTPPDPGRMIIGAPTTKTYVGLLRNAGQIPRSGSVHPHLRTQPGEREVWGVLFGAVGRDLAPVGLHTCSRDES